MLCVTHTLAFLIHSCSTRKYNGLSYSLINYLHLISHPHMCMHIPLFNLFPISCLFQPSYGISFCFRSFYSSYFPFPSSPALTGVPEETIGVIEFVELVRKYRALFPLLPVVTHCSAGIGRTGKGKNLKKKP